MKTTVMKRIFASAAAFLLVGTGIHAQTTAQTTFLLDNYVYGYRFNPAYVPEKSFVGLGIGNINLALRSETGLSNYLFATEQGLVTGLNSAVSKDVFLRGLTRRNAVSLDLTESLLSVGARGKKGGYSNFELNLRTDVALSLPYDLFALAKCAGSPSYDLSPLHAGAHAYLEVAYGHSRWISEKLSIGWRAKALIGMAGLDVDVRKATIETGPERLMISADAIVYAGVPMLEMGTKDSEYTSANDVIDFGDINFDPKKFRLPGYGAAIDFGAIYKPLEDLDINLSINDLGVVFWTGQIVGKTGTEAIFRGENFFPENESTADDSGIGGELESAIKQLSSITEFHRQEGKAVKARATHFAINAGARYRLPQYRNLAFGATAVYRYSPRASWYDLRAGAAITPVPWFSLTGNLGYSSFGPVCGGAFSVNAGPINLFLALDGYMGKITGDLPIPINSFSYNANLGIDIIFGKRVRTYNAPNKVKEKPAKASKKGKTSEADA